MLLTKSILLLLVLVKLLQTHKMMFVNFNLLRRVGFGLLSVLLLCSATLKFTRVVRITSFPSFSTLKTTGSALKKARCAQPQKSKKWMKDYNKESNKTFNKSFISIFIINYSNINFKIRRTNYGKST